MDFKLAQVSKEEIGEVFIVEGIHFKVLVTPENQKDFAKYCKNFDIESFTDESAIPFCSDGQYEIRAIRLDNGEINWEYPELQQL